MLFNTWTPLAVSSEAFAWRGLAWRMIEAQHIVATMKLVDTQQEQFILETLLEQSKPGNKGTSNLDYLLATPFRYHPWATGSRFRAANDPGVFYAAQSIETACAELGHWRWKFLKDAVDLDKLEPVAHTAIQVSIAASLIDLRKKPFVEQAKLWLDSNNYQPTQELARVARTAEIAAILYQSVRDPNNGWCVALLHPKCFSQPKPTVIVQTWWLAVYQDKVIWRKDQQFLSFYWH